MGEEDGKGEKGKGDAGEGLVKGVRNEASARKRKGVQ